MNNTIVYLVPGTINKPFGAAGFTVQHAKKHALSIEYRINVNIIFVAGFLDNGEG